MNIELILEFVNEYYHVFILLILFGAFIVSLFKNKSKKSDFIRIFDMVNKAEELFPQPGSGSVKLAYVIKQLTDIDPDKVIETVEKILASPEKK